MLEKANEGGVKCCEKAGNWKIRTRKWDERNKTLCVAVRRSASICMESSGLKGIDHFLMGFKTCN